MPEPIPGRGCRQIFFIRAYVSQKPDEDDSAIYMSATDHGKDSKLLAKKASAPGAAR